MARMRLTPRAGVEIGVDPQHFVDLPADRHHRVERGHRLLKDHRHAGGAQLPQAPVAEAEDFLADQLYAAAGGHQRTFLQQPHHRQRCHRLAGAAFADQAERLGFANLQRDAVDDALVARVLAEADDEVVDVEDDVVSSQAPCPGRGAAFFMPLRRTGTYRTPRCAAPALQRTAPRRAARFAAPGHLGSGALTCRPRAVSCGDRARRGRRRRSG